MNTQNGTSPARPLPRSPRAAVRLGTIFLGGLFAVAASAAIAQGPPGRDSNNPPPGHGGVPPGQAKKYDNGHGNGHGNGNGNQNDWRFQNNQRDRFYSHYQRDADRWRGNRRRPNFARGQAIPSSYRMQPVPQSYWQGAPPPAGYQYGYYDGYVVAYNPTTRIIADVLDLVTAAATR